MQDQVAGSTLYASSFDLSPSLGQGTTGSELPAKRVKSVADTPYTTPPLSPYVRKVEVIVSYDPEKLTSSPLSSTMKGFSTVTDMSDMTRTEPGTCVISPPKLDNTSGVIVNGWPLRGSFNACHFMTRARITSLVNNTPPHDVFAHNSRMCK